MTFKVTQGCWRAGVRRTIAP